MRSPFSGNMIYNVACVDPLVLLVGLSTCLFEATVYIYALEWTPALQEAKEWVISERLPLGFMFSGFMVSRLFLL